MKVRVGCLPHWLQSIWRVPGVPAMVPVSVTRPAVNRWAVVVQVGSYTSGVTVATVRF